MAAVLILGGTECFFRSAAGGAEERWLWLAAVGLGVVLLGLAVNASPKLGIGLSVSVALAVSVFISVTAFSRFRGLAKDLEASPSALIQYGGRIFLAVLAAVAITFAGVRAIAVLWEKLGHGQRS